jgi:DivIVA domain-containing protein
LAGRRWRCPGTLQAMEREEIIRVDFPSTRRGYSPEAVEEHLTSVAEYVIAIAGAERATPASDLVAESAGAVLAAAETAAAEVLALAEVEAERMLAVARDEAERIRAAARSESEEAVSAANLEASGRIEQARAAVEGLVAQADRLRAQVGALGRGLASSVPGAESTADARAEVEGDDDSEAEADADGAEPTEPTEEAAGEPEAGGEKAAAAPSNEDMIAELRAAPGGPAPGAAPAADHGAARLVAMNMALDGASRDEIAREIEADFGSVSDVEALLDDVLGRVGR